MKQYINYEVIECHHSLTADVQIMILYSYITLRPAFGCIIFSKYEFAHKLCKKTHICFCPLRSLFYLYPLTTGGGQ